MPIHLVVRNGPHAGRVVDVESSPVIGREGCDVEIDDPRMSRRHASLVATAQGVYIADLGSSNGTYVNGARITASTWLRAGDVVLLGATEISVEANPAGATVAYAAPAPPAVALAAPAAAPAGGAYAVAAARRPRAATRMPMATLLTSGVIVVTAIALLFYFGLR